MHDELNELMYILFKNLNDTFIHLKLNIYYDDYQYLSNKEIYVKYC